MIGVDDGIWSGNLNAADVLFAVAMILFAAAALIAAVGKPDPTRSTLIPLGLALVALAWLAL